MLQNFFSMGINLGELCAFTATLQNQTILMTRIITFLKTKTIRGIFCENKYENFMCNQDETKDEEWP